VSDLAGPDDSEAFICACGVEVGSRRKGGFDDSVG
jgi:hypothetical protein